MKKYRSAKSITRELGVGNNMVKRRLDTGELTPDAVVVEESGRERAIFDDDPDRIAEIKRVCAPKEKREKRGRQTEGGEDGV